jgi:hypothetical protein
MIDLENNKSNREPYDTEQKIFIGFFIVLLLSILAFLMYIFNKHTITKDIKHKSYNTVNINKSLECNHSIKYKRIKLNY